jgi:hypothetical protein
MTKIAGSGSISQRHDSEDPDPDPPQNVMDLQHWVAGQCLAYGESRSMPLAVRQGSWFWEGVHSSESDTV